MAADENKTVDKARVEELLVTATHLQAAFWDSLTELEAALDGMEIDGTRDLSEMTVDDLLNAGDAGIEPN